MSEDLLRALPELLLTGAAVLGLLLGSFLPRTRQWPVRALAAVTCVAALAATAARWPRPGTSVFEGTYSVDVATGAVRVVVLASVLLVLALSGPSVRGTRRETEFVVLTLLAALGAVLLAGADDVLLLTAAYLLASIPLYALTGLAGDSWGTEATMKYYLLGALVGVTMLVGLTILFGLAGATTYPALARALPGAAPAVVAVGATLLLAGPLFKAGAVPVHFWVPDVTEGTRTPVAALVTTVPKIGAVVAVHRVTTTALDTTTVDWRLLVAVLAALTMTLGNLAAFFQDDARRLLAYSTVSQVGYLLIAVAAAGRSDLAVPGLLLYLAAYAITNLGAFAVVAALPRLRALTDYRGAFRRRPGTALALTVCLLGLVGTPPTGVFAGKLTVFTAAFEAGLGWLVVVAIVNTVASLFYYLRWIAPTLRTDGGARPDDGFSLVPARTAFTAAALSLAIGPLAGPILGAVGPLAGPVVATIGTVLVPT
ncbi:NADH-quinone oxidoreductase subunit N [Saccharomonospora saliphila]|uniref:NADH-quinone oxidoreductase subunit N n=1 Tax=Saccharomonospora saliphila TaxID=369829 RepID=UPI00036A97D0|nr:NADH-quinone oxidoreductase subunit N [Saccharomonospora saliphila]